MHIWCYSWWIRTLINRYASLKNVRYCAASCLSRSALSLLCIGMSHSIFVDKTGFFFIKKSSIFRQFLFYLRSSDHDYEDPRFTFSVQASSPDRRLQLLNSIALCAWNGFLQASVNRFENGYSLGVVLRFVDRQTQPSVVYDVLNWVQKHVFRNHRFQRNRVLNSW